MLSWFTLKYFRALRAKTPIEHQKNIIIAYQHFIGILNIIFKVKGVAIILINLNQVH